MRYHHRSMANSFIQLGIQALSQRRSWRGNSVTCPPGRTVDLPELGARTSGDLPSADVARPAGESARVRLGKLFASLLAVAFHVVAAGTLSYALALLLAAPALAQNTPTVSRIFFYNSPASGDTYTRGETVRVEVEFDGDVDLGNPHLVRLALTVGNATKQASPVQTSKRGLIFAYTVAQSDIDTDGMSVPMNPISLNGATITVVGDPDTDVPLAHAGVGDDATRKVNGDDVVAPTIQSLLVVNSPFVGDTYLRGEKIVLSANFDKNVIVAGSPQLVLTIGTSERRADFFGGRNPSTAVRFQYTVEASDLDADGISVPANAVDLNGGSIKLADNTVDAAVTHAAIPADPTRKVDGTLVLPPIVEDVWVGFQPTNGVAYRRGEEVRARVRFDRAIEVTGRPQLALTIGTNVRQATFSRIWGIATMEFHYVVQATDMDEDGISIAADALTLNGGSITGPDRTDDAVLTHSAVADDPDHKVNADSSLLPEVVSVDFALSPSSGDTYKRGEKIYLVALFTHMADVTGSPRVALTIGSNTRYATYHSVSTPRPFRLLFDYTVHASDTDTDGASIPPDAVDLNGGAITTRGDPTSAAVLTHSGVDNDATRKVNGTAVETPAVTSVTLFGEPVTGMVYTLGETIWAYAQFDNNVDVTGRPQLALEIGSETRQADFDRVHDPNPAYVIFSYTVQASDRDDNGVAIPANALSLNGGTITLRGDASTSAALAHGATAAATNKMVDGSIATAPEVLSVQFVNTPSSGATYAAGEAIEVEVRFDKTVDVTGTPRLRLEVGGSIRYAEFESIAGPTVRFSYRVRASEMDVDGINIPSGSLTLNGGTIKLVNSSVDAHLIHSALNADDTRRVEARGTPPQHSGTPPQDTRPLRMALWTDQTDYRVGDQVRLYRTMDPRGDRDNYKVFFYLERVGSDERRWFAPGVGSHELRSEAVDHRGKPEGFYGAGRVPNLERELAWEGDAPSPGLWQFVAELRGEGGEPKRAWARFVVASRSQLLNRQGVVREVRDELTLRGDTIYYLLHQLFVRDGATLRIEPGTLLQAWGSAAEIIVEPGGRIEALGEQSAPVVLTCSAPTGMREPGCWGGLRLLGRAPVTSGESTAERGLPEGWSEYGGAKPEDSSGVLRYVRVEFAGGGMGTETTPALGLYGAGSGTVLEYVQTHASLGDGIVFDGGTAICDHCVASGSGAAGLAWERGWRGGASHLFVQHGPEGLDGIFGGNDAQGHDLEPRSRPSLSNVTLVHASPYGGQARKAVGLKLRTGSAVVARNLLVMRFWGAAVDASGRAALLFSEGVSSVTDAILFGNGSTLVLGQVRGGVTSGIEFDVKDPRLRNVRWEANPDPRPDGDAPALVSVRLSADTDPADSGTYVGAFGQENWLEGWTLFGPESDYNTTGSDNP